MDMSGFLFIKKLSVVYHAFLHMAVGVSKLFPLIIIYRPVLVVLKKNIGVVI